MARSSLHTLARLAATIICASSSLTALAAPQPVISPTPSIPTAGASFSTTTADRTIPIPTLTHATSITASITSPPVPAVSPNVKKVDNGKPAAAATPPGANIGIAIQPGAGLQGNGENILSPADLKKHAKGGALDPNIKKFRPPPGVALGVGLAPPPQLLTINIINSHSRALSKTHARNWDSPTAAQGMMQPGVIATGVTTSFAVPTGWAGMVALGEARWGTPNGASLIEASFVRWDSFNMAVAAVDVSYVDAFTVPIVCSCDNKVVTGCNKGLWGLSYCPNRAPNGACMNPTRAFPDGTTASPFFSPCRAAAYTFAKDDLATSMAQCQSGTITCCVGRKCPANPNQPGRGQ